MNSIPKKLVRQDAKEERVHTVDIRGTNKTGRFPAEWFARRRVPRAVLPNSIPRRDGRATRIKNNEHSHQHGSQGGSHNQESGDAEKMRGGTPEQHAEASKQSPKNR
jgi:hypothetical protein